MGDAGTTCQLYERGELVTLKIDVDAEDILATVDSMLDQLSGFTNEITKEFLHWQAEDMRRKEPDATQEDKDVYTIITPRSTVHNRPQSQRAQRTPGTLYRRQRKPITVQQVSNKPRSTRPILRQELFERLEERMLALMKKDLGWQ